MENEIWRSVVGYEGLYEISTLGRVKRLARVAVDSMGRKRQYNEAILTNRIGKQTGYPCVNLSKDGKVTTINIHTLIADAFIPNPDNLPCINHKDENRANSVLSNLERCTYKYNMMYGSAPEKRRKSQQAFYKSHSRKPSGLFGVSTVVYQYTLDGKLIEIFKGGATEVEEKLGFSAEGVGSCCRHKNHSAFGYVWRYEGDDFSFNRMYNKGKKFPDCKPKSHQKFVILVDENGKELMRYKSVSEAGRKNGFDRHRFSQAPVIDGIVIINDLRFIVEQKENEYIPKGHKGPRPDLKGKISKPVCQYTKDGEFVKEFPSVGDAAIAIGKTNGGPDISNCCNGKLKTAYGFIWRYKGDPAPAPFKNDVIRRIEQYSFDGELIATHESITDAIKSIGYGRPTCIGNNLAGRSHSAYGYVWKYAE